MRKLNERYLLAYNLRKQGLKFKPVGVYRLLKELHPTDTEAELWKKGIALFEKVYDFYGPLADKQVAKPSPSE